MIIDKVTETQPDVLVGGSNSDSVEYLVLDSEWRVCVGPRPRQYMQPVLRSRTSTQSALPLPGWNDIWYQRYDCKLSSPGHPSSQQCAVIFTIASEIKKPAPDTSHRDDWSGGHDCQWKCALWWDWCQCQRINGIRAGWRKTSTPSHPESFKKIIQHWTGSFSVLILVRTAHRHQVVSPAELLAS